jgi:hypothetical protein
MEIANHELLKALGRANECMRRLIEAGLSFDDLQVPINDPRMRERLVRYWKNPITALNHNSIVVNRNFGLGFLDDWMKEFHQEHDEKWAVKWQDEKIQQLKEIDLNGMMFESGLPTIGSWADIKERIEYLKKAGRIFPDAHVFKTLWENQSSIPAEWKTMFDSEQAKSILFVGTTFGEKHSEHFNVLRLSFYKDEWHKWTESSVNYSKEVNMLIATIADLSS